MDKDKVLEIFQRTGALKEGHFILTSGRHSSQYLQCAQIFQYPDYSEQITALLAQNFSEDYIDVVIGPAIGGIILSYEMGRLLGVKTLFAERENGIMTLRRDFKISQGSRVLVVEDVVTTGGSVKEVIELVDKAGGKVVGVGAIVDRSNGKVDFGCKFSSVISMEIPSFEKAECPLCKQGVPAVKPGSRHISKV
ncbi:MAG: orotate phosphoribosyltransferase [Tissierellia bacterium]|nr:orotate phosphoribosyltransferase [Tissierellia bacterium]